MDIKQIKSDYIKVSKQLGLSDAKIEKQFEDYIRKNIESDMNGIIRLVNILVYLIKEYNNDRDKEGILKVIAMFKKAIYTLENMDKVKAEALTVKEEIVEETEEIEDSGGWSEEPEETDEEPKRKPKVDDIPSPYAKRKKVTASEVKNGVYVSGVKYKEDNVVVRESSGKHLKQRKKGLETLEQFKDFEVQSMVKPYNPQEIGLQIAPYEPHMEGINMHNSSKEGLNVPKPKAPVAPTAPAPVKKKRP